MEDDRTIRWVLYQLMLDSQKSFASEKPDLKVLSIFSTFLNFAENEGLISAEQKIEFGEEIYSFSTQEIEYPKFQNKLISLIDKHFPKTKEEK